MKRLLLLVCCLAGFTVIAQVKEGKIVFEQKIDMHRRIPEDNQQMRSMIPPTRTSKFELEFADNQTLYKGVEEEPDLAEQNTGGRVIRFNNGAENEYYKNFTTRQVVESRELMQEMYLLQDSIRSITWKLEDNDTKMIAGYTCKKATGKSERGSDVIAWYAEEIPVAGGPEQFNGLPGMILAMDINKGEMIYTAVSVEKKADKKSLKAPVKGKKVTGAEFAKKQQEVFGNGNGNVRIVTN